MPLSRFPRPGQPIAAQPLRDFLRSERVSRFDRLDATAWRRLGEERCRELARQLVRELERRPYRLLDELGDHTLSSGNGPIPIDDLELQARTRNCFVRAGISELPGLSNGLTVAEASHLRGFGVSCLVDLMASLEAHQTRREPNHKPVGKTEIVVKISDLPAAAQKLLTQVASIPGVLEITRQDPRLGVSMRAVSLDSPSLGAIIESLRRVGLPKAAAKNLVQLCDNIRAMAEKPVVKEVADILAAGQGARAREIIQACLQLRDQPRLPTYRSVGRRLRYSGERVRRVFCRQHWRPGQPPPFAPALDRALAAVCALGPCWAGDVERLLARDKLLAPRMRLEVLDELAGMLGREPGFVIMGRTKARLLVAKSDSRSVRKVQSDALALVNRYGLTTVKRVIRKQRVDRIGHDVALRAMISLDGFYWVNEPQGAFSLRGRQANPLWHRVRKVLSVAPRVSIDILWVALKHDNRSICGGLTAAQVLAFCQKQPECRVSRDIIMARKPEDPLEVLQGHEREVVGFILEHGPLCWRRDLMRLAAHAGIAKPSFDKCINCPAISRYAPGVYGLTGAEISASALATFVASTATGG